VGRFDPIASEGLGSCYFAEQPEGCFLEVFKSFTGLIPKKEVEARLILRAEMPREIHLADCTSERARAWGITGEIHSTPHYEETQAWAHAFARAGFGGVRYLLRHDPAQRMVGVALFGPAGSPEGFPHDPGVPIGADLIDRVAERFGIRVW
jgi:RES domain-containing protein